MGGDIIRENLGNLSVVLIIISAPYRNFLVIQPIKNGTGGFFFSYSISKGWYCSCCYHNYHGCIKLYYRIIKNHTLLSYSCNVTC